MSKSAFNQNQFDDIYPVGIENHYWTIARNRIIKNFLINVGVEKNKILEIGCGKGVVVNYLRKNGFECYGVEIAPIEPISTVCDYIKIDTDFALLDEAFRKSIETALLFDVIEHIEDDKEFLINIRNSFPNLKQIIITVPARRELWTNYDEYNGHFRRYSLADLKQLAQESSFFINKISYFFHSLYVPIRLFSLLKIKRATQFNPPQKPSFTHQFLAWCFFVDYKILPSTLWGASMICSLDVQNK